MRHRALPIRRRPSADAPPRPEQARPSTPRVNLVTTPVLTSVAEQRLSTLETDFCRYLEISEEQSPFWRPTQLACHLACVGFLDHLGLRRALSSEAFHALLLGVLQAWGVSRGRRRLVGREELGWNLEANADRILELQGQSLEDADLRISDVATRLWALIEDIPVSTDPEGAPTRTPLVGGSKLLHHLLPELVPPMDRRFTQSFFGWGSEFQTQQEECFRLAFQAFAELATLVRPSRLVGTGDLWRTGPAKVLDSALVGFCLAEDIA